jgi:hypothetical protein
MFHKRCHKVCLWYACVWLCVACSGGKKSQEDVQNIPTNNMPFDSNIITHSTGVGLKPLLIFTFNESVKKENVDDHVTLKKKDGPLIETVKWFIEEGTRIVVVPSGLLESNQSYVLTCKNLKSVYGTTFEEKEISFTTGFFNDQTTPVLEWDTEENFLSYKHVFNNALKMHGTYTEEESGVSWGYTHVKWNESKEETYLMNVNDDAWEAYVPLRHVQGLEGNAFIEHVLIDEAGNSFVLQQQKTYDFIKPVKPVLLNPVNSPLKKKNLLLRVQSEPRLHLYVLIDGEEKNIDNNVFNEDGILEVTVFLEGKLDPYVIEIFVEDPFENKSESLKINVQAEGYACLSLINHFPNTQGYVLEDIEDDGDGLVRVTYALLNNALVRDTFINGIENKKNTNWGAEPILAVGDVYKTLFYLDTSLFPACAETVQATWILFRDPTLPCGESCSSSNALNVHLLDKEWTELFATWTRATNTLAWTGEGASSDTLSSDSYAMQWDDTYSYLFADITPLVNMWQQGSLENKGFLVVPNGSFSVQMCSTEYPDILFKPRLVLTLRELFE